MRGKFITVFSIIVLLVGGLSYALTRMTLGNLGDKDEAKRALSSAVDKLQVDGLVLERWIATRAADPSLRDVFSAGTENARASQATQVADKIRDAVGGAAELGAAPPDLVAFVSARGVVVGRNGSQLMRGDDLGAAYPFLKASIDRGATGSDLWVNHQRHEQLLVSFAPIRGNDGALLGMLVVGSSMNDGRLNSASERTSGKILIAAVKSSEGLEVIAKSKDATPELLSAVVSGATKDAVLRALGTNQVADLGGLPADFAASSRSLEGFGDGHRAALVAVSQDHTSSVLSGLIWPAIGVSILGLVLVVVGSHLLDAYISQPIAEIEDGLLAIINGRGDLRFQIEHAELGGLVFRLNSLLNQLLEVQEDDTDEQGRPSMAPTAQALRGAVEVDEQLGAAATNDQLDVASLRDEPEAVYYARLFREYLRAKKELGDPVGHITESAFVERIAANERDLAAKHGKPVRYRVETRGNEVVLLAVPLA